VVFLFFGRCLFSPKTPGLFFVVLFVFFNSQLHFSDQVQLNLAFHLAFLLDLVAEDHQYISIYLVFAIEITITFWSTDTRTII
ncbi:hypothetical protein ACJX0J_021056, partial [Zea mays]